MLTLYLRISRGLSYKSSCSRCLQVEKLSVGVLRGRSSDTSDTCKTLNDFLKKYSNVFISSEIGCLPGLHHIDIDKNAKQVIHSPRRVPATLQPRNKAELERMESIGVASLVKKPIERVSSMVPVVKPNKLRICIDPFNLNQVIKREHHPMKTIEEVVSRLSGEQSSPLCMRRVVSGKYS